MSNDKAADTRSLDQEDGWRGRLIRMSHRFHARLALRSRGKGGFTSQPEPRTIGSFARGRQLCAGNFHFAGFLVEGRERSIWDLPVPGPGFTSVLQGFSWLDDLAAVGDSAARKRAQDWTFEWIGRYGAGRGPGWTPDLTGRRLIRWINHAILLLNGRDKEEAEAYFRSLAQQSVFLSRRWKASTPGLPRFEALTGLIYAGLALQGMERLVAPAVQALARECETEITAEGGISSRNPEELLEVFTLLTWAAAALGEAGRSPPDALLSAIDRVAPTLRALRHADGGMARFHGGGRGAEGRLDQALSASGVPVRPTRGLAMGYARLAAGRTTVIVDAAAPPAGSPNAHASTLAMEVTSGRRPLIVNCGSGISFGPDWHRAGRATPSHSTLGVTGFSSSRLGASGLVAGRRGGRRTLDDVPLDVWCQREAQEHGQRMIAGHDGYAATHGLTHVRELVLDLPGRVLEGTDTLGALTPADKRRFEQLMKRTGMQGIGFDLRFHLHPDVDATLDLGGTAVSMALKSGEIWIFRHDGVGELKLEASAYLERGRLKPRPTRQIVLSARVWDEACQLGWTLAKAQDTPAAIRDLHREETTQF